MLEYYFIDLSVSVKLFCLMRYLEIAYDIAAKRKNKRN